MKGTKELEEFGIEYAKLHLKENNSTMKKEGEGFGKKTISTCIKVCFLIPVYQLIC